VPLDVGKGEPLDKEPTMDYGPKLTEARTLIVVLAVIFTLILCFAILFLISEAENPAQKELVQCLSQVSAMLT
jgi:hypothetical protein